MALTPDNLTAILTAVAGVVVALTALVRALRTPTAPASSAAVS